LEKHGLAEKPMVQKRRYRSYLLRLWQEGGSEGALWRASLERPESGERLSFASLGDLFAFLEEETGSGGQGSQVQAEEGDDEGIGADCAPDPLIR
jgi:hypothetical protein